MLIKNEITIQQKHKISEQGIIKGNNVIKQHG